MLLTAKLRLMVLLTSIQCGPVTAVQQLAAGALHGDGLLLTAAILADALEDAGKRDLASQVRELLAEVDAENEPVLVEEVLD